MLEAALNYAARGWAVIPLHVRSKKPRIQNWAQRATTKSTTIRKWWAECPDGNIGIVPKACEKLVLDIDPRNGGDESVMDLGREIIEAPTVLSGGVDNGKHLYFERPDETVVQNIRRNYRDRGIDVPAYVVAPPSVHPSGRTYAWEIGDEDATPIPLPTHVLEAFSSDANDSLHSAVGVGGEWGLGATDGSESRAIREISGNWAENPGAQNSENFPDPRPMLATIAQLADAPPIAPPLRLWAWRWVETPALRDYVKNNGYRGRAAHASDVYAFALEAVRAGWNLAQFLAALAQKRANSPDVAKPSATSNDRRNPFDDRGGCATFQKAMAQPFQELPIAQLDRFAANPRTRGAARVYAFLLLEAYRLGVRPANMAKDSRTIAKALGVSQSTARRWTDDAAQLQLLTIVSRGRKRVANDPGASARYAIATRASVARRRTAEIAAAAAAVPAAARPRREAAPARVRQRLPPASIV